MEREEIKSKVCDRNQWYRVFYIVFFAIVLNLVITLVGLVTFVQILFSLFTGKTNSDLLAFSKDLTRYIQQVSAFLMYVDDRRPFPFKDHGVETDSDIAAESNDETQAKQD